MPIFLGFKNQNLHSVKDIRSLGVCQSSGELSSVGDKTKFNCYLVDSQILRPLAGESGETEWFLLQIDSLSSTGDLNDMLI